LFNIVFTPDNHTLSINIVGDSSVTGNVTLKVYASAYGYNFLAETLDPCTEGFTSLCPLSQIQTDFDATYTNISSNFISKIPNIAYGVPDLDATVKVYLYAVSEPTVSLACVQLSISNGKTVNQLGVKWGSAVVTLVGLAAAALLSGPGYANTAAHMMLYALALFSYFQAVAMIGLCAVPLPPIVLSWTQDMSWSVGIIKVNFLQTMATWYQTATGGTPSTILNTLSTKSVEVAKRSLVEGAHSLYRRTATTPTASSGEYVVSGIDRLAYIQGMESTNLFFTGVCFYIIFVTFSLLAVMIFKELCELAIRAKWLTSQSYLFNKVRNSWRVTVKGIILRLILIGYPPMVILCLWEFTRDDSPAEIILAIIFLFGMSAVLALVAFNVFQIAKRSEQEHKTPAYLLYADATVLKKWGFLYVQFRATAYFYVVPILVYVLVKGAFIGLGQKSGITQAIALVILEAFALIGASVVRPWMDTTTNSINIAICVINFLNSIFLLIFTNIFNGPGLLIGVTGVVFFIMNVVFALVLLITVLFVVALSFFRKNPDTHYFPVADDRASFIKSQTALSMELAALGMTARGGSGNEEMVDMRLDSQLMNSSGLNQTQHAHIYSDVPFRDDISTPSTPNTHSAIHSTMHSTENFQADDNFAADPERDGNVFVGGDSTMERRTDRLLA
jgi:hypothetical protein